MHKVKIKQKYLVVLKKKKKIKTAIVLKKLHSKKLF